MSHETIETHLELDCAASLENYIKYGITHYQPRGNNKTLEIIEGCIHNGSLKCIEMLVRNGLDLNEYDRWGYTILNRMVRDVSTYPDKDRTSVILKMLELKADPCLINSSPWGTNCVLDTVTGSLCYFESERERRDHDRTKCMYLHVLFKFGGEKMIDLKDPRGCFPLMRAIQKRLHMCLEKLIYHGENVEETFMGDNLIDYAQKIGNMEAVRTLQEKRNEDVFLILTKEDDWGNAAFPFPTSGGHDMVHHLVVDYAASGPQ